MHKLYGFINTKGEEIIEPKFKFVSNFQEGLAQVEIIQNNFLFINKTGENIFSIKCDEASSLENGYVIFKKNNKYGVINKKGEEIIKCNYDKIKSFMNGVFAVNLDGKCGIINEKGEEIIECEFQEVKDLNKGKFCGKYENKWGLYDLDGSCYIENNFSELKYIGSFLANYAAMTNGKWEIIDCWGNIKSTNNYISINNFYSDFSLSSIQKKKSVFLDIEGEIAIDLARMNLNKSFSFHNGFGEEVSLAKISKIKNNIEVFGFLNLKGQEVIECQYDRISGFSEGLARVGLNYKFGFIDGIGNIKIDFKYKNLGHFRSGLVKFESINNNEKLFGFLDTNGDQQIAPKYSELGDFHEGLAFYKKP